MGRMGSMGWVVAVAFVCGGVFAAPVERNNFVTVLAEVSFPASPGMACSFENPRKGWILVAVASPEAPVVRLDDESEALIWRRHPETGRFEAMRFLAEGAHRLSGDAASEGTLCVSTVPELAFCYYPSSRFLPAYGPYDWEFMNRFILSEVNTIVTHGDVPPEEFDQWRREGRQWLSNAALPGLSTKDAPSEEAVYGEWAGNPGMAAPGYSGVMVDEFLSADDAHYASWLGAIQRLHANPANADRVFYAWSGDLFAFKTGRAFSRNLLDMGYRFSWERYLREEPNVKDAQWRLDRYLVKPFARWKKFVPGFERNVVICLGYLSAPPETLNLDPSVDYHVYMDMQFHLLATDAHFRGLYGVMEYVASYADEESIRWAHRMFRHYCIEGKTSRLIARPLALPHLENPDFVKGLGGWEVTPFSPGAIAAKTMKDLGWLQGRYPQTEEGDTYCWMRRSETGPNRISQRMRDLEPGTLYSVKLISAGMDNLHEARDLALSIAVEGAETLPEYGFQNRVASCYSHESGDYTRDRPACFNYHRLVFRPAGTEAVLSISDWRSPETPGAPAGQETGFNFVEVQPFLAP